MEKLVALRKFWKGRRVLITGHTGFKGSWLTLMLNELGAEVYGLSNDENIERINWLAIKNRLPNDNYKLIDVCDYSSVKKFVEQINPNFIFHLAGQPLVSTAFMNPLDTIKTNVIGSSNVLELFRLSSSIESCIIVTSDKVYSERDNTSHNEASNLGGSEVYSASKASVEVITSAYSIAFQKFFSENDRGLASARAGNVIGGGDWSENRLVPDLFKSILGGNPLHIRNMNHIRPWQYIFDVLYGYILLGYNLSLSPNNFAGAWNFSNPMAELQVSSLIKKFEENLKSEHSVKSEVIYDSNNISSFHETKTLMLNSSKASTKLGWKSLLSIDEIVNETSDWYMSYAKNIDDPEFIYFYNLLLIQKFFGKIH